MPHASRTPKPKPRLKQKLRPPKRVRLAPEARQALILDHAAEIVARDGVSALSMDSIGREAGISKSLVYNYFPNTTDLLRQLLQREWRRLRRLQVEAAREADTFEALVRSVTHVYLKYIDERGMLIERLQAEPSVSAMHDPTEFSRDSAVGYLAEIVADHFGLPMDIAKAATDISFGLPATAGAYLLQRKMTRQALEDLTVTMILGTLDALKREHIARRRLPRRARAAS
ncbi:MAG: TetR/AcrR family transcriptional regulator [Gammaproteobacteria bacterium]|jgi:AcrR family transcriptional regulator